MASIFSHDMTPHDPYAMSYQPSAGKPARDNRRKKVMEDSYDNSCSKPQGSYHPIRKIEEPVIEVAQPGDSSALFAGKSSSRYTRNGPGLNNRFKEVDEAYEDRSKVVKKQGELYQIATNQHTLQYQQRMLDKQNNLAEDMKMLATEEPWGKPSVGDLVRSPTGSILAKRQNKVAKGDHYQHSDGNSYVDLSFNKQGAGSPRKDAAGHIDTRKPGDVHTLRHYQTGPADAYVAQNFGKAGPGGVAPRDAQGNVHAQRGNVLGHNKHYVDCDDKNSYSAQVFGRSAAGVAPPPAADGQVHAQRRGYIEKNMHHEEGPVGSSYRDLAFGKGWSGAPPEPDERGQIHVQRPKGIGYDRHHDGPDSSYTAQAYGKDKPRTDSQGNIKAYKTSALDSMDFEGPPGYVDYAFGRSGGGAAPRGESGEPSGAMPGFINKEPEFNLDSRKPLFRTDEQMRQGNPPHRSSGQQQQQRRSPAKQQQQRQQQQQGKATQWSRHATHMSSVDQSRQATNLATSRQATHHY